MVADSTPARTVSFSHDEVVVGSAPDVDLVLDRPGVAERHVRIAMRARVLMIEDLRPTNRPPRAVEPTDIVRIAGIDLQATLDVSDGIHDGIRLLDEIRQRPGDLAPRTVYADWCEEHGHPERAMFLRQQLAVAETKTASDPDFRRAAARLAALAPQVGNSWRARVAMAFIERCPLPAATTTTTTSAAPSGSPLPELGLELVCPMRWDKLAPTEREGVRWCSGCGHEVTYCTTIVQARGVARRGGCLAIDLATERSYGDLEDRPPPSVGMPTPLGWRD
jgi:uncharacterized protein (TIGR02996 family)